MSNLFTVPQPKEVYCRQTKILENVNVQTLRFQPAQKEAFTFSESTSIETKHNISEYQVRSLSTDKNYVEKMR